MSDNVNDAVAEPESPDSYNESVHDLIIHGRAISIRGVNYHFGAGESRSQVLFDNRLDIGKGEVVIMTGPSGSGKTTLLTLIGGLRSAQVGSILVNGRELVGVSRPRSWPTAGRSASSSSTTTSSARCRRSKTYAWPPR